MPHNKATREHKIRYYYPYILQRGNCSLARFRKQSMWQWLRLWELEFGPRLWHIQRNVISTMKHCSMHATCCKDLMRWYVWKGFRNWKVLRKSKRWLIITIPRRTRLQEALGATNSKVFMYTTSREIQLLWAKVLTKREMIDIALVNYHPDSLAQNPIPYI